MLKSVIIPLICIFIVVTSSGCIVNPNNEENNRHLTAVLLSSPRHTYSDPDDNSTLDVEVQVLKITPKNANIRWNDVYMYITASDGNTIFTRLPIEAQSPPEKDNYVIHTDDGPNTGRLDPNETILFVGMDERFFGANWDLLWILQGDPEKIAGFRSPFKVVNMTFISAEERIEDATTWYDLHFEIDLTFSPGSTLKWNDCQIELGHHDSRYEDIPIRPYPIMANGHREAWFNDTNFAKTTLDIGDTITLTGLTVSYQDGWMRLYVDHEVAGWVHLPSHF